MVYAGAMTDTIETQLRTYLDRNPNALARVKEVLSSAINVGKNGTAGDYVESGLLQEFLTALTPADYDPIESAARVAVAGLPRGKWVQAVKEVRSNSEASLLEARDAVFAEHVRVYGSAPSSPLTLARGY